ncbi:MAG: hypothetical protein AAGG38_11405 [Planctomycetota bacterium]
MKFPHFFVFLFGATACFTGCGAFTNHSVVSYQLTATADQTRVTGQQNDENFGIEVHRFNADGTVSLIIDQGPEMVTLQPDVWVDLPLRDEMQQRRILLLEADAQLNEASMIYEEAYESGVPILRHL